MRLYRYLSVGQHLTGAALMRIGIASVLLYYTIHEWPNRAVNWGPDGMYPLWLFLRDLPIARAPSLFAVESFPLFHSLYLSLLLVSALYLIGWKTRWVGIWVYVLCWSLFHRNPMLMTGGEKLLLAVFPYIVFLLDTSTRFSVDAWMSTRQTGRRPELGSIKALLHNVGVFCVMMQLAITYGFSGGAKLFGEAWRDGSAVYYVMRAPEFALPGVSEAIYLNEALVPLLTYATMALEISFPLLIWSDRTRWVAQTGVIIFHGFIAVVMGLVVFAAYAIALELVVADDRWYARIERWLEPVVSRARRLALPRVQTLTTAERDAVVGTTPGETQRAISEKQEG